MALQLFKVFSKMIPLKKFIPAIGWFFLVLILICLPGQQFPKTDDWLGKIFFDKWVHAGLFAILAFLFMKPYVNSSLPKQNVLQTIFKIGLYISIWGLITELIQKYFVPNRSFDLWDWVADSAGALLAFIICKKMIAKK
jgi:VanZ family protein